MAYIGKVPPTTGKDAGASFDIDDVSSNFDGSTTAFAIEVGGESLTPTSTNVFIFLGGVLQHPGDAYTISGSNIAFTAAPESGTSFHGTILGHTRTITPDQGTVGDTSFGDTSIEIRSTSSTGRLYFTDSDTSGVGAYVGSVQYHHTDDSMRFETGGNTTRLRIDSDGLKFGTDTAAANALDDYEEGSFNPTFVTSSGSISMNTSYDTLQYTKIGRMVHIMGQVVLSVSSPGGNLDMASLPFNFAQLSETSERGWAVNIGYFNGSGAPAGSNHFSYQLRAGEGAGTSTVRLQGIAPNDDGSIADWCGNGTDLWFNFWYIAT